MRSVKKVRQRNSYGPSSLRSVIKFSQSDHARGDEGERHAICTAGRRPLRAELEASRPPGMARDEVLYADDTIIFSTAAVTLEKLLQKIEKWAETYGLKLNQSKCENICTDPSKKCKLKAYGKK